MTIFILKRFLLVIPIVIFLSFITLLFINMVPGNYFDSLRMNPQISEDIIHQYEERFHVGENIFVQYFYWIRGVMRCDFGYSFAYQQPVMHIIRSRLFNTFLLSFVSLGLAWLCAVPLGVIAAICKGKAVDKLLLSASYILLSFPGFFLAMLLVILAANYTFLPIGGMRSIQYDELSLLGKCIDIAKHMIIPVLVLSSATAAYLFRLMRSNMLSVLHKDFIRVLYARGISTTSIVTRHAIRNAINPLITILGLQLPALFSGAALVEIITGWPGLGTVMLQAVRSQDIFLVMGNMVMISVLLIVGNLFSDITLAITDPKVKY